MGADMYMVAQVKKGDGQGEICWQTQKDFVSYSERRYDVFSALTEYPFSARVYSIVEPDREIPDELRGQQQNCKRLTYSGGKANSVAMEESHTFGDYGQSWLTLKELLSFVREGYQRDAVGEGCDFGTFFSEFLPRLEALGRAHGASEDDVRIVYGFSG